MLERVLRPEGKGVTVFGHGLSSGSRKPVNVPSVRGLFKASGRGYFFAQVSSQSTPANQGCSQDVGDQLFDPEAVDTQAKDSDNPNRRRASPDPGKRARSTSAPRFQEDTSPEEARRVPPDQCSQSIGGADR